MPCPPATSPPLPPRSDRAGRGPQATEVRGDLPAAIGPGGEGGLTDSPRGRASRGGGGRRESLRFRFPGRAPVRRDALPGIPPRRALRARRPGDGRQHPASLPGAQRLRSGPVLRPGEALDEGAGEERAGEGGAGEKGGRARRARVDPHSSGHPFRNGCNADAERVVAQAAIRTRSATPAASWARATVGRRRRRS